MPLDGPDDTDPLAEVGTDHGGTGTQLSPWTWVAIIGALVLAVGLLVVLV